MKRGIYLLIISLLANVFALPISEIKAADNLIANPSFETVSNNQPSGWSQGYLWGDLDAQYQLLSPGHSGNYAGKVTISRYASGDAKWYFNPVVIQPSSTYTFTDFYQSNTNSSLVLQTQNTNGSYSYTWLKDLPASPTWQQSTATITTNSAAANITIFHLINSIGYLTTDDYNLSVASVITPPPPPDNLVPNPSVETVNPQNTSLPLYWHKDKWGTNTAGFSYLTTGHTGNRSVKITMTKYTNGDAKWYFDQQQITPGTTYEYSDYYQANVTTQVVVWLTMSDGSDAYLALSPTAASTSWSNYKDTFTAPANAVKATVFHLIQTKGSLVLDDESLKKISVVGFNRPQISLTFDDGWESQYQNGLPLLEKYNVPATFYLVRTFLDTDGYMTTTEAQTLQSMGMQIGSHTMTHPDLTTLSSSQLTYELGEAKTELSQLFGSINDFASPYGAYNDTVLSYIKQYYQSHRTVEEGYNTKTSFDPYRLKVQNILNTTTPAQVQQWITQAKSENAWLILVYHDVQTNPETYGVSPSNLETELQEINSSGIHAATVRQALTEINSQL